MKRPANVLTSGVYGGKFEKKHFSKFKKPLIDIPNLVDHQVKSYQWLLKEGIGEVLKEFSPIKDYADKKFELSCRRNIAAKRFINLQSHRLGRIGYQQLSVAKRIQGQAGQRAFSPHKRTHTSSRNPRHR